MLTQQTFSILKLFQKRSPHNQFHLVVLRFGISFQKKFKHQEQKFILGKIEKFLTETKLNPLN